jgi:hypothetical protein
MAFAALSRKNALMVEPIRRTCRKRLLRISMVFSRVANPRYADTLPRGMRDLLLAYARRDTTRHSELTAFMLTPTYETAARCLLRWFNEKFVPPPRR